MNIAISGATGYIGGNLIRELKVTGHHIVTVDRNELNDTAALSEKLSGTDVVINLAGCSILCRWTNTNKDEILTSRVETTLNIVKVINQLPLVKRPKTFISASAVGIYSPDLHHTESSTSFSDDFVGEVVKNWENSSAELSDSVRRIIFRIGVVLGKESKTMKQLLPFFKLGLGGRIGSGKQPFPFVHINDVTRAFSWVIQNPAANGIYNLVASQSSTNMQLTSLLSKALHRPAFFTVPEFALKLIYGEAASLLLKSPVVYPERLLNSGFQFKYPDIQSCLAEIIS